MSKTTTGVAAAGLVMPAWVPTLETVSATAAALVLAEADEILTLGATLWSRVVETKLAKDAR